MPQKTVERPDDLLIKGLESIKAQPPSLTVQRLGQLLDSAEALRPAIGAQVRMQWALYEIARGSGNLKDADNSSEKSRAIRERAAEVFAKFGGEKLLVEQRLSNGNFDSADLALFIMIGKPGRSSLLTAAEKADREFAAKHLSGIALEEGRKEQMSPAERKRWRSEGYDPDKVAERAGFERRREAIEALGLLGGSKAEETLVGALGSKDQSIIHAAIRALGNCGWEYAVEPLGRLVLPGGRFSLDALDALERIGNKHAEKSLVSILKLQNENLKIEEKVISRIVDALGRFGTTVSVAPLRALVRAMPDMDVQVDQAISAIMERAKPKKAPKAEIARAVPEKRERPAEKKEKPPEKTERKKEKPEEEEEFRIKWKK